MLTIIVGCGRMGSGLAHILNMQGQTVHIIDTDPTAFERLGASFRGQKIVGVGYDRDVLVKAGIEHADALAALTPSDEVNVVTARVASMVYRVPRVVARLYDPLKAEIYKRLGLNTIAPVTWGVNRIADVLNYSPLNTVYSLGTGEVDVIEIEVTPQLEGRAVKDLNVPTEITVVAVSRGGRTFLPTTGTVFMAGDILHLVVQAASADKLKAMLGLS
ncbi:MAG: TrkA family potassium uptake protein [Chloroflexi bacterium]|nr:TrkA family potassium uptake protein [Chloroflexota bacterium]